jgi:hypothetical protein
MSFSQDLSRLVSPSAPGISRPAIKRFMLRPLTDPAYLSQILMEPQISKNKLVASVEEVWKQMGNDSSAYQACVSAINTIGSMSRQDASLSNRVAVTLQISLAQIAMHLSKKFSRQVLLDVLRQEYAHLRRDAKEDTEKRIGMALCLIVIIQICIQDRVPGIVDSLVASGQGILDDSQLPKSVSIRLKFFMAKHLLFLDDFEGARTDLLMAFNAMNPSLHIRNREIVLMKLIPLQLAKGLFPNRNLLRQFSNVSQRYLPVLKAVRRKDVKAVRSLLESDETLFYLTRRIELWVYRGILREVFAVSKRRIDLEVLDDLFSGNSSEEILANMIQLNLITGYISYEERALMLTGSNPFPV